MDAEHCLARDPGWRPAWPTERFDLGIQKTSLTTVIGASGPARAGADPDWLNQRIDTAVDRSG